MAAASRHYCDHNATTELRPVAKAALIAALDATGNASSVHTEGQRQRGRIEDARRLVARLLGRGPADVTFTSGATEALNTLAQPTEAHRHLFLGATEHAALRDGHRFGDAVTILPVDNEGRVTTASLDEAFAALPDAQRNAVLVAVQAANNETGVIQPLDALAAIVKARGASLLVDAVQAAGRLPLAPLMALADALVLSSHKVGGPAGAGAIVYGTQDARFLPLIRGGGQERRRRAGTENAAAIAGFAAALEQAAAEQPAEAARLNTLRETFENAVRAIPGAMIVGQNAERLPNTTCVLLRGIAAEKALIAFDIAGFALSSGSACSSGKVTASHVLTAMGFDTASARSALRISFGWSSTEATCEALCAAFPRIAQNLSPEKVHAA